MIAVLSITLPIFAVIALGYVTTARGVFSPTDIATLSKYVILIALPALLFNAVASMPLMELFYAPFFFANLSAVVAVFLLSVLWFRLRPISNSRRMVAVMESSCPNTASFVYPILLLADPKLAIPVLAMNMVIEHISVVTASMAGVELVKDREPEPLHLLIGRILWSILRRPMILAIVIGITISLAGVPVPEFLTRSLDILGKGLAGIMLFVIGGSLVGLDMSGDRWVAVQIAAFRLLVGPVIGLAVLTLIPAMGFTAIPTDWALAVLITCGAPMFGIYPLLSRELGHEKMASLALVLAILGAFVTMPVILALMTQ